MRPRPGTRSRRNFPVIGRLRYLLRHLGVFFRQYFYAMDREELPFNRAQRAWGLPGGERRQHRSVRIDDLRPVGTVLLPTRHSQP